MYRVDLVITLHVCCEYNYSNIVGFENMYYGEFNYNLIRLFEMVEKDNRVGVFGEAKVYLASGCRFM